MGKTIKETSIAVGVPAILAIGFYVAFQIFSDILSTKLAILPILNLAVDGGTVIYPLTFTIRDFVHKTLGKDIARKVVIMAGAFNLIMVLLFALIGVMTPDPSWAFQESYNNILMPVFRISIASIIAEIISEIIDTEIFSKLYKKLKGRFDTLAVLGSNAIALIIDTVAFCLLAFYGSYPLEIVVEIIVANVVIKGLMSLLAAPLIKLFPRKVAFDKM